MRPGQCLISRDSLRSTEALLHGPKQARRRLTRARSGARQRSLIEHAGRFRDDSSSECIRLAKIAAFTTVKYLKFVSVSRDGKLLPEVVEVLSLIAQHDLTLATGHVTPEEALMILREAKNRGVQHMIVTHPLLGPQYTYMSIDQLAEAASLGAYMEVTAGTLSRDTPARTRAFAAIRKVGAAMAFISSDSGLTGGPNHPDALAMAAKELR